MHENERNFIFLNKCQNARLVIYKRHISGRDALLFCCVHTEDMLIQHLHAKSCFHCNRKLAQQSLFKRWKFTRAKNRDSKRISLCFSQFVHTHCYCFVWGTFEIKTTANYLNHEAYHCKRQKHSSFQFIELLFQAFRNFVSQTSKSRSSKRCDREKLIPFATIWEIK